MKKGIIFCIGLLVATAGIAGGPWVQKKGKGFYKLSEWWIVFDQHYTDVGLIDPNVTTGIFNTTAYVEHGISDRFTGVFNGSIFSRNYMNNIKSETTGNLFIEGEALNSLGDIDLGIKYGITKPGAKFPIAASVMLGLPTGTASGGTQGNLQTGDGEFNQILTLHSGTSFKLGKSNNYTSVGVGFNKRSNGFSDEFRYNFEYGIGLMDQRLWMNVRLVGVESFKNAEKSDMSSVSIFANNSEFTSLGFEANYYVKSRLGFSAGVAGAFRGEIIAAAPSFTVGVFLDLSK